MDELMRAMFGQQILAGALAAKPNAGPTAGVNTFPDDRLGVPPPHPLLQALGGVSPQPIPQMPRR